jgi:signal transduction histidine kinase
VSALTASERPKAWPAVLRAPFSASTWLATAGVAAGLPLGLASFVTLVVLVSVGVPTLILALVGLPLLWCALGVAHGVAHLERLRMLLFGNTELAIEPLPTNDGSIWARWWLRTRTLPAWRQLIWAGAVMPVLNWALAAVVFAVWGGVLALLTFPAYGGFIVSRGMFLGVDVGFGASLVGHVALGLALLLTAPWVARAALAVQYATAHWMLAPNERGELQARVSTLADSRSRMVSAAEAERRRIERDLHDGAQQRLVALAMALGRAKSRMETDPEGAQRLVDEAHGEAKLALAELRNLARGIHPAVLTDRGLDAALSALAARCPVPVQLTTHVDPRPAPGIEAVAYFIVAELLTNVSKHAQASSVRVDVERRGERLLLSVIDDGIGGADFSRGTGLTGLRDRAEAVDGAFTVFSPAGGPTTVIVELPCVS